MVMVPEAEAALPPMKLPAMLKLLPPLDMMIPVYTELVVVVLLLVW